METDNQRFNATVQPNSAFLAELKEKLPEFFTRNNSFDLEKFQAALKEKNVSELSEGYQLNFIGKDYARRQAGEMPTTVIVPDEDQNNGAGKNSQNLFFTGDNLEVLRHLQNNYQNKIDVIYIDPPYNTGSDGFVYPDSFEYSDDKLKEMFGMNDDQVARLKSIQGKASHSAWLTFMYPRLFLAKRLLSDTGVIFISIDDNELESLKMLMNELFGDAQFIGNIAWESKTKSQNTSTSFDKLQPKVEHILVYTKVQHDHFNLTATGEKHYQEKDSKGSYRDYILQTMSAGGVRGRKTMIFPIEGIYPPEGKQWKFGKDRIDMYENRNDIYIEKGKVHIKIRPSDETSEKTLPFWAFYSKDIGTAESAKKHFEDLMSKQGLFDTVKPVNLIKDLVFHASKKYSTVLDFFAGSSTTADAVMQLNAEDGGHRKFIMVQLPEKTYHTNSDGSEVPTKGGKAAYEAGFRSIDEISRERIRRAAAKIKADNELTLPADFDGSFKHYRVVKPSRMTLDRIEEFKPETDELVLDTVNSFSSQTLGVAGNASGEQTVLATWLAKDGYPFDVDVQKIDLAGYQGNLIENNRLYLIREGWSSQSTEKLLNLLGTHTLNLQAVVIFGYSFNLNDLRELENGLKQLDGNVSLIKRY
ncbi:site-specific DNA-methyltransferase [Limosilactobacillus mucosae]|uniref:site-specific DNA-methyltransferase n=1 Tax=Limosilactobacillus mucosae TaxID=97478 RepID=UPI0022E97A21|nr:site-specific DNA-methyltransferase [Limosilactobacillus mucosae]